MRDKYAIVGTATSDLGRTGKDSLCAARTSDAARHRRCRAEGERYRRHRLARRRRHLHAPPAHRRAARHRRALQYVARQRRCEPDPVRGARLHGDRRRPRHDGDYGLRPQQLDAHPRERGHAHADGADSRRSATQGICAGVRIFRRAGNARVGRAAAHVRVRHDPRALRPGRDGVPRARAAQSRSRYEEAVDDGRLSRRKDGRRTLRPVRLQLGERRRGRRYRDLVRARKNAQAARRSSSKASARSTTRAAGWSKTT